MPQNYIAMTSPRRDSPDVTRERIIRQTPRPRLSLSALRRRDHCGRPSLETNHGMGDEVKVRNRFQHSQNNVLCFSNSINSPQHVGMLQNSKCTLTQTDGNHSIPEEKYTRAISPANYDTRSSVDGLSTNNNICSRCHENTIVIEHNMKKCHNCGMFSLIEKPHKGTPVQTNYALSKGIPSLQRHELGEEICCDSPLKGTNNYQQKVKPSGRHKSTKVKAKSKICLTISSDEEENKEDQDYKKQKGHNTVGIVEKEDGDRPCDNAVGEDNGTKSYRISKLSDRMKPQGGKPNKNQSVDDSSGLPILATTSIGFELNVQHVQLGSLAGKGTTPLCLQNDVLRIEIECSFDFVVENKKKKLNEKYKLALSSVEVSKIIINCEPDLLFIAIVPSKRYSDVVNEALSRYILDAESTSPFERWIIFIVHSSQDMFKQTVDRTLPHLQRISSVSYQLCDGMKYVLSNIQGKTLRKYPTRSSTSASEKAVALENLRTMFVYPLPPKKGGIALTNVDVDCLDPGVYLNDIIIDFYLKYLYEEILTEKQRGKTYIFNSYFYTRLSKRSFGDSKKCENPMERMHSQVRKWTRDVDIFEKDFIIIPVNEHSHWFLVIICFASRIEPDDSVDCNESNETASSDGIEEVSVQPKISEERGGKKRLDEGEQVESIVAENKCEKENCDVPMDVDSCNIEIDSGQGDGKDLQGVYKDEKEDGERIPGNLVGCVGSSASEDTAQPLVFEQPCILLFDSLISGGRSKVFSNLRSYLTLEWKDKRQGLGPEKVFTKKNLKASFPKIPLQNNDCDCGVYILQFAESFFQNPILNFKFPIRKETWFSKEHVDAKRDNIKEIISNLEKQFSSGN